MARILVLDEDALARAVLIESLRGMGHETVAAGSTDAAVGAISRRKVDLAVLVSGPTHDVLVTALALADAPPSLGMIAVAPAGAEPALRRAPVTLASRLDAPADLDAIVATVRRLTSPAAAPAPTARVVLDDAPDEWQGAEFLARVDGSSDHFPPSRVLFLAHRVAATGRLTVDDFVDTVEIGVRAGRVVFVEGLPGLLAAVDPALDAGSLAQAVGQGVALGHDVTALLGAAAARVGAWLASAAEGRVRFDAGWTPPPGSFPLPEPVPRLIASGLRRARPQALAASWDEGRRVFARVPDDADSSRWGLDALAARVLRDTAKPVPASTLARRAGDQGAEVLRALDFLVAVGLVAVDDAPAVAPTRASPPSVAAPLEAARPADPDPVAPEADEAADPRLEKLRAAEAAFATALPIDVLELGDRKKVGEDDVSNAYREISKRYHPDLYFSAPPDVRALAESCFARVNAAHDALRAPGGLSEARRVLEARGEGRAYVGEKEFSAAKVAFRKGEIAFRNRDWQAADDQLREAVRLDPATWPYALNAAHAGWLSRRLPTKEAVAQLDAIAANTPQRAAEVQFVAGNLYKLAGQPADALARWKAAVERDPNNRDAQRELRLHDRRAPPAPAPAAAGIFSSWLGGGKKG